MECLRSDLFARDAALQAALNIDSRHVTKGARGPHVGKIQSALALLLPDAAIAAGELTSATYGKTTAAAVLRYKTENGIINHAYQSSADDITGRMTMRALDTAMIGIETELGADMLRILAKFDEYLFEQRLRLPPAQQARFERLRRIAVSLLGPGALPDGRFEADYRHGVAVMERIGGDGGRPAIVFAALPLVIVGVGIAAFLAALAALIALILLTSGLGGARSLGHQVSQAINEAIDAGEAVILDNVATVEALDAAVEQCKRRSQNRSAACAAALAKFDLKKLDVVAIRNELLGIIREMKNASDGSISKFIWKLLVKRAESAANRLAAAEKELREIVKEIMRECGCQFIKV